MKTKNNGLLRLIAVFKLVKALTDACRNNYQSLDICSVVVFPEPPLASIRSRCCFRKSSRACCCSGLGVIIPIGVALYYLMRLPARFH
jgi:hypothetical protein